MSYCTYCREPNISQVHIDYHDHVYGYPVETDNELFGRLVLEINQAGLSWELILKKKKYFELAFDGFDVSTVAGYDEADRDRLRNDTRIIRNRLKINAAIHNAQQILQIQAEFGTFKKWLDDHHPRSKDEWVTLFKKRFKFVGGEIVNEYMMALGYLPGAHDENCPVFDTIMTMNPKWSQI